MSAFVVHRNHVLYLVAAMLPGALGRYPFSYCHVGRAVTIDTPAAASIAANVLAAENVRSVHARYGERGDALADAFQYVFTNGADHSLAGMFDFEIAEDAKIAREALAGVQRERPWLS